MFDDWGEDLHPALFERRVAVTGHGDLPHLGLSLTLQRKQTSCKCQISRGSSYISVAKKV